MANLEVERFDFEAPEILVPEPNTPFSPRGKSDVKLCLLAVLTLLTATTGARATRARGAACRSARLARHGCGG